MLTKNIQQQIIDAIKKSPRSIDELAKILQINWRTADRYVDRIIDESGLIAVKVFRPGSRGALKVVFWNALDSTNQTAYQERLFKIITAGRRKEDFSPMDIYQVCDASTRRVITDQAEFTKTEQDDFNKIMNGASQQVLSFSGNLSWISKRPDVQKTIERLAKKHVKIKILTRIDTTSYESAQQLLNLNIRFGSDLIEIRHCEQPLRALVIDDSICSLKEVLDPAYHSDIKKKTFLFYRISDQEWIAWMQKTFWHLWANSIDAKQRVDAIRSVMKH